MTRAVTLQETPLGVPAGLWLDDRPLVLASRSIARLRLLAGAGIPVECVPADIDERAEERLLIAAGSSGTQIAVHLARAKAHTVSTAFPRRLVIGADQTLSLGESVFAKPADRAAAARQLERLAGHTHRLQAAVAVMCDGKVLFETIDEANLTMRTLSPEFIGRYLDTAGEAVCSSVGAYQLEGLGVHLFTAIDGDNATILGMPILPLLDFLRAHGSLAA